MDVLRAKAAVEPHVAVILENGVVAGVDDPGVLGGVCKLAVVLLEFGADGQPALLLDLRIAEFLTPGLNRKIGLALGNDFLGGIGILDDEVAGVARHHHGLRRPHGTLADLDHIGDLNEMIVHPLATIETGRAGRLDDGLKIPVIRIAEHASEVPAGPVFVTRRVSATDGFEGGNFVAHGFKFS